MAIHQMTEILPATRMANVRYAIRDLAVVADEVARQGHDILYLNIGDPCKFDFPTPPHMIDAVLKAMRDGHNGYADSLGIKPAIEAIHNQAERNGFRHIQSIFIGYGSGEVIDSCITALLNPGDNVLTPRPEYPLYGAIMGKLDCPVNDYDLDEDNGWEPDVADIERKINSRTRAILLINPNNPTGAVYSRQTLEKILELARQHGLVIFADEIYDKLIFDPAREACLDCDPGDRCSHRDLQWTVEGVPGAGLAHRMGDCDRPARDSASLHGSRAPPVAGALVGAASVPARHQSRRWKGRRTTFPRCAKNCGAAPTLPSSGPSAHRE